MSRIIKPNSSHAKEILFEFNEILLNIRAVIRDHNQVCINTKNLVEQEKEIVIKNSLSNLPIDKINEVGSGVRVSALKKVGINTISQLCELPFGYLKSIRGVGDKTAMEAKYYSEEIKKSVAENTYIRINSEKPSYTQKAILQNIQYVKDKNKDLEVCSDFLNKYGRYLEDNIKKSKIAKSRIRWIFSFNQTKKLTVQALENLEKFLASEPLQVVKKALKKYDDKPINDFQVIKNNFSDNTSEFYAILENIVGERLFNVIKEGYLPKEIVKQIESISLDTSLLKCTLRGYQKFGAKYSINQGRTLIGDEMGLGKTIEAISVMAHKKSKGSKLFLVICPASVLINWSKEIRKHSMLNPIELHGGNRNNECKRWIEEGGVGITTYATMKRLNFSGVDKIDLLVADEAHYVKNPSAKRSQSLFELTLRSHSIMFMTGTPLENNIQEMKNLIYYLQPDLAKTLLNDRYIVGVEQFRNKVASVYLRRNREDVLFELPELIENDEWIKFGNNELMYYYKAVKQGNFMLMRRVAWLGENRRSSPKLNRLLEICYEAKSNNRKVIIFSFFRDVIDKVHTNLGSDSIGIINGSTSPKSREELIERFTSSRSKTALVCQIQAGGVGLNIQAASVVIFCEPQVKPSLENQALSRAYRMGQKNNVIVYRLLTQNSVDERMMEILRKKQRTFDLYAKESKIASVSHEATSVSLEKEVIKLEKDRLGITNQ